MKKNVIEMNEIENKQVAIQPRFITSYDGDEECEGVEQYFKRTGHLDGDKIRLKRNKDIYITLDEIKSVYEYAKENNKPCPIVVDYKRKSGHFVFRRWIKELNDIFDHIDIENEIGVPYQGLHNTSLEEDGHWFPSAEDMESIIAFAYNKTYNLFETDRENILYVTNIKLTPNSKAEQLINYYNDNKKDIDDIVTALPDDCGKMQKCQTSKCTDEWRELGNYKNAKVNNTPKTDILSEKYKISFKKAGGSQLMSGFEQEAHATLMSAASKLKDKNIDEIIEKIFNEPWLRNINSNIETEARENAQRANKVLTELLNKLCENDTFKKLVLVEAASGDVKFGTNSAASANTVFVWSDSKAASNKMYFSIEDYIEHIFTSVKFLISLKTSTKTSTSMRIIN